MSKSKTKAKRIRKAPTGPKKRGRAKLDRKKINGIGAPAMDTQAGIVWAIANKLKEKGKFSRAKVMEEAGRQGVKPGTSATQFALWRIYNGIQGEKAGHRIYPDGTLVKVGFPKREAKPAKKATKAAKPAKPAKASKPAAKPAKAVKPAKPTAKAKPAPKAPKAPTAPKAPRAKKVPTPPAPAPTAPTAPTPPAAPVA